MQTMVVRAFWHHYRQLNIWLSELSALSHQIFVNQGPNFLNLK